YALGAILYHLLAGRPPFVDDSAIELLIQVRTREPERPNRAGVKVPRDLETICLKCLEKAPSQRYASALDLADDLRRFLDHLPIHARRTPPWERGWKWMRRRPVRAALLAVFVVLALSSAAAYAWYWDAPRRVKVAYFTNLVSRWAVPDGVGPLSQEEVGHRSFSCKFYYRGGKVFRVDVVNAFGELNNLPNTYTFINGHS